MSDEQTAQQTLATLHPNLEFLAFKLGDEEYGIDIQTVQELRGYEAVTGLANVPDFIKGVVNLRGIIVPIMDLRARFGMESTKPTRMSVVIIINTGARTTGLLVDAVSDIISVSPDAVRPIPDMGGGGRETLLAGLVAMADRMVSLVSLDFLMGSDLASA